MVDENGTSLLENCTYAIFGRRLSAEEYNTIPTAFFDDFRRWREVVLKVSRKIVARYRQLNR